MLTGKGIWTTTSKRFSHSTLVAGICPKYIDLPMSADTWIDQLNATTNYNTSTTMTTGKTNAPNSDGRILIQPNFSTLPGGSQIQQAYFNLTPTTAPPVQGTLEVYRCLRDIVYSQATSTIWKTSNNWATPNCRDNVNDYEGAVLWGSVVVLTTLTINVPITFSLDASEMQKIFIGTNPNYGLVIRNPSGGGGDITRNNWASTDHGTAAYRPTLTIVYL